MSTLIRSYCRHCGGVVVRSGSRSLWRHEKETSRSYTHAPSLIDECLEVAQPEDFLENQEQPLREICEFCGKKLHYHQAQGVWVHNHNELEYCEKQALRRPYKDQHQIGWKALPQNSKYRLVEGTTMPQKESEVSMYDNYGGYRLMDQDNKQVKLIAEILATNPIDIVHDAVREAIDKIIHDEAFQQKLDHVRGEVAAEAVRKYDIVTGVTTQESKDRVRRAICKNCGGDIYYEFGYKHDSSKSVDCVPGEANSPVAELQEKEEGFIPSRIFRCETCNKEIYYNSLENKFLHVMNGNPFCYAKTNKLAKPEQHSTAWPVKPND